MHSSSTSSLSQSGFRSRRSYPSLHQVSLAPLTPRFPIDDDGDGDDDGGAEPQDYFSPRNEPVVDTPPRTSYLSSYSVPGTPGVLSHSHSRSGSRVRHPNRSQSSTTPATTHLSDPNLQAQDANQPLHHHADSQGNGAKSNRPASLRHHTSDPRHTRHRNNNNHSNNHVRDSEWMLRAGIALASSAREEKGQSWLVKRESSTSLVSEGNNGSGGNSRRSRSGRSTPAASGSRRASRSRPSSRQTSRPDLAMTSLEMTAPPPTAVPNVGVGGFRASTEDDDEVDSSSLGPDFVDEQVRAEMRTVRQEQQQQQQQQQQEEEDDSSGSNEYWDSEVDEEDEMDEHELQRLTRERGFGLGSWVDRMVEWTLFGVDEWPLSATTAPPPALTTSTTSTTATTTQSIESTTPSSVPGAPDAQDNSSMPDTNSEILPLSSEKAGERGGWEDAGWLFRAMKRAWM
ncbi:hypothetical protein ARAM_004064 [Aspergillus rambellii]|uniref:Uncharacterized protein n=1 Tax=Aspergillus rambellii TaxID=308745 RepID=A0A0F8VAF2_9EURO|nr:hypothetical protein ARAM_004064 [Aspergillus rambellii]